MGAVTTTEEVYCDEIHSREGLGWFLAHAKRFLEIASQQQKKMTVMVRNDIFFIYNMEDLEVMRCELFARIDYFLKVHGEVIGRVTFTS